jgi:hypothetical protein
MAASKRASASTAAVSTEQDARRVGRLQSLRRGGPGYQAGRSILFVPYTLGDNLYASKGATSIRLYKPWTIYLKPSWLCASSAASSVSCRSATNWAPG